MFDPVDKYVGNQLKSRRTIMGLSQAHLGDKVGVTFQQVQKYEKGSNRVSASMLYKVANILETSVSYFFEGLENGEYNKNVLSEPIPNSFSELTDDKEILNKEVLNLFRYYRGITDIKVRKKVISLVKALSTDSE